MEKILRGKLKLGHFQGVSPARRRLMQSIRSRGTRSTEAKFRMALVGAGIRGWYMNPKDVPAKPDVFFPSRHVAIFLDGCFWHGCKRCGHVPKTNSRFWRTKFQLNKHRDRRATARLAAEGVTVMRFWEHELKKPGWRRKIIFKLRGVLD
jgi:DNA mismatch endonuclease, patch repair protein